MSIALFNGSDYLFPVLRKPLKPATDDVIRTSALAQKLPDGIFFFHVILSR
jgi:hypothetical protein